MKLVIILCLVVLAYAQPQRRYSGYDNEAQILRYDNDYGYNRFRWAYETSNDIRHEQQGEIRNQGREDEYLAVKGQYSWVGPNGVKYTVTYVADDNGYQPEIEQGPGAVPAAVAATLIG